MRRVLRAVRIAVVGLIALLVLVVVASAISNTGLPTRSPVVERLSDLQKARIAEAFRLRETLGDRVWPGWDQVDIPVIVYNEEYAFLVGYPDPPAGWVKVPQNEQRGAPWEPVPGDTFQNATYYRQRLLDPEITPENFTVLVGDRWVATLQTKEYSFIDFVNGFREQMPALLRPIVPYRLVWHFLGGDTEIYLGALAHESFHAYQGMVAETRLAEAERLAQLEDQYPWTNDAAEVAWQRELNLLARAAQAESNKETTELARQFLTVRQERRQTGHLPPELVDFERQREWLEGLAKYAELSIIRQAAEAPGYEPVSALMRDPDFEKYASGQGYWNQQMGEVTRMTNRSGEVRFYYSGFAQAALLDRLLPDWKAQELAEGIFLEELLDMSVGANEVPEDTTNTTGQLHLRLRITSQQDAPTMIVRLSTAGEIVDGAVEDKKLAGVSAEMPRSAYVSDIHAAAGDGVQFTLTLKDSSPVTLLLEDHVYSLPDSEGTAIRPRPAWMMPSPTFITDSTLVSQTVTIE